jgi:hypothetical protein
MAQAMECRREDRGEHLGIPRSVLKILLVA